MDLPLYLKVLWRYRVLLLLGVVVATVSGVLAGYTVEDGRLVPRAQPLYDARATLILSQPDLSPFQTETEPELVEVEEGQAQTELAEPVMRNDLSQLALIYAYFVTSNDVRERVADEFGPLGEDESFTAVRRTTQPAGDERFPGRYSLPFIDVVARSPEPARVERLSAVATSVFLDYVSEAQQEEGIPEGNRVDVDVLRTSPPEAGDTSSPLLPVILVAGSVMLAFVAAAFVLSNIASSSTPLRLPRFRRRRGEGADTDDGAASVPDRDTISNGGVAENPRSRTTVPPELSSSRYAPTNGGRRT